MSEQQVYNFVDDKIVPPFESYICANIFVTTIRKTSMIIYAIFLSKCSFIFSEPHYFYLITFRIVCVIENGNNTLY